MNKSLHEIMTKGTFDEYKKFLNEPDILHLIQEIKIDEDEIKGVMSNPLIKKKVKEELLFHKNFNQTEYHKNMVFKNNDYNIRKLIAKAKIYPNIYYDILDFYNNKEKTRELLLINPNIDEETILFLMHNLSPELTFKNKDINDFEFLSQILMNPNLSFDFFKKYTDGFRNEDYLNLLKIFIENNNNIYNLKNALDILPNIKQYDSNHISIDSSFISTYFIEKLNPNKNINAHEFKEMSEHIHKIIQSINGNHSCNYCNYINFEYSKLTNYDNLKISKLVKNNLLLIDEVIKYIDKCIENKDTSDLYYIICESSELMSKYYNNEELNKAEPYFSSVYIESDYINEEQLMYFVDEKQQSDTMFIQSLIHNGRVLSKESLDKIYKLYSYSDQIIDTIKKHSSIKEEPFINLFNLKEIEPVSKEFLKNFSELDNGELIDKMKGDDVFCNTILNLNTEQLEVFKNRTFPELIFNNNLHVNQIEELIGNETHFLFILNHPNLNIDLTMKIASKTSQAYIEKMSDIVQNKDIIHDALRYCELNSEMKIETILNIKNIHSTDFVKKLLENTDIAKEFFDIKKNDKDLIINILPFIGNHEILNYISDNTEIEEIKELIESQINPVIQEMFF